jgi:hypothetical protein
MKDHPASKRQFETALRQVAKASGESAERIRNLRNRDRPTADLRLLVAWQLRRIDCTFSSIADQVGWRSAQYAINAMRRIEVLESKSEGFQAVMKKLSGIDYKPTPRQPTSVDICQRIASITKSRRVSNVTTGTKKERRSWSTTAKRPSVWQRSKLCTVDGGAAIANGG